MGKRWIAISEESNYGVLEPVHDYHCMPYKTLDLQPNQNPIAIEESDERMKTGYMYGGFVGLGTMALLGRPDNLGWYLKWAMGTVAGPAADGDLVKHVFTQGEDIKSFSVEEDIGEGLDNRFLTGCVMKRLTLESVMNGPMLMTNEIQYNTEILDTQVEDGAPLPVVRPFALHDAVVKAPDAVTLKVESIRVNIENTVPDDAHVSGDRLLPDISLEGFSISGELELRFESWAQRQRFYGAQVAGPAEPKEPQKETRMVDLDILWTGPATTTSDYKLHIDLPEVMLTENPVTTTARERLKQRLSFEAIYNAGNDIELSNDVITYVL